MSHRHFNNLFILMVVTVLISGCATTRARRPDAAADLNNQVTQLQTQLQDKDRQIQELESKLESYQRALQTTPTVNYSPAYRADKSSMIRVAGVSALDLQKALQRAGLDPGPIDGKIGRQTKSAVKEFQKRNNLNPDGIVGKKTWALLQ